MYKGTVFYPAGDAEMKQLPGTTTAVVRPRRDEGRSTEVWVVARPLSKLNIHTW